MKFQRLMVAIATLSMILVSVLAFAGGGTSVGGGGDASEVRIDDIRADILKWIREGGAKSVDFAVGVTYAQYVEGMTGVLQKQAVVVGFVENDDSPDEELRVIVNNVPKTCRGFISVKDNLPHLLCNIGRFNRTSESGQYILVHHEYASLAGLETNIGAASDYALSNQITTYLEPQIVLKLAVKRPAPIFKKEDEVKPPAISVQPSAKALYLDSTLEDGKRSSGMGGTADVLVIVDAGGSTVRHELEASVGYIIDRLVGSYRWEMTAGHNENNLQGVLATSGDIDYAAPRIDVANIGIGMNTPFGGHFTAIGLINSLQIDRSNGFLMVSEGVRVRFDQKLGPYLKAFVGGTAAVVWGGDEKPKSDGTATMVVLAKPGLEQDGAGGYFAGNAGLTVQPTKNLEFGLTGDIKNLTYRVHETGFEEKQLAPTKTMRVLTIGGGISAKVSF